MAVGDGGAGFGRVNGGGGDLFWRYRYFVGLPAVSPEPVTGQVINTSRFMASGMVFSPYGCIDNGKAVIFSAKR